MGIEGSLRAQREGGAVNGRPDSAKELADLRDSPTDAGALATP